MILLIDNYDSFVHTLAGYVRELGGDTLVRRNDALSLDDVAELAPTHVILSPGPCSPAEARISVPLVQRFGDAIPILGVCLGHQCIAAAYGGQIVRAPEPVHGETSAITHDGSGLFAGLPNPFRAARYHSLAVNPECPGALRITARDDQGVVMAATHPRHPVFGVQFHPESVLSEYGHHLIRRFLDLGRD